MSTSVTLKLLSRSGQVIREHLFDYCRTHKLIASKRQFWHYDFHNVSQIWIYSQICVSLARLLDYLSNSPIGSLIIRDFKLSQFVMVNGDIKLTDFDDVDNEEPKCLTNRDCLVSGSTRNKTFPCHQGRCKGVLSAKNLFNAGRNFISHILVPGGPEHLKAYLREIKNNVQRLSWDSGTFARHMEKVHSLLRSGEHLGIMIN